jgi:hypothetical protein
MEAFIQCVIGLGLFIIQNGQQLVGFILPPVVDYLSKDVHKEEERTIVSFMVCALVAFILNWDKITMGNAGEIATSLGLIYMQSQFVFKLYFKRSRLRNKLFPPTTGDDVLVEKAPSPP